LLYINKNYRLLLIGKTDKKVLDYIKDNNLEEYIIITGVVDNVYDYLNIMDVFLFPSIKEGYGLSLIEAQQYDNLLILASSNITRETNISNRVHYLDLNVEKWVYIIENNK